MADHDVRIMPHSDPDRQTAETGIGEHSMDIIRIILSIIIPPVGVFLQVGFGLQFWVNVLLTIFGYVPGLIHALYIILSR